METAWRTNHFLHAEFFEGRIHVTFIVVFPTAPRRDICSKKYLINIIDEINE